MPRVYGTPPPAPGYPAPYGQYVRMPVVKTSVGGLGVALSVLLGFDALFALWGTVSLIWRDSLLTTLLDDRTPVDQQTYDTADTLIRIADGLLFLTMLGSIVVFMCWFWAARSNAEAYAPYRGTMSVGWSVGGWFIPLANLVIPCIVARDVYRGTMTGRRGRRQESGGLITGWWWAVYVLTWILLLGVSGANSKTQKARDNGPHEYFTALRSLTQAGMVALPVLTACSVLAICYVQTITREQRQRNAAGDWYDGPASHAAQGLPPMDPGYGYGYGYGTPMPGAYPMPGPPQDAVPPQYRTGDDGPFAAPGEDLRPPS